MRTLLTCVVVLLAAGSAAAGVSKPGEPAPRVEIAVANPVPPPHVQEAQAVVPATDPYPILSEFLGPAEQPQPAAEHESKPSRFRSAIRFLADLVR